MRAFNYYSLTSILFLILSCGTSTSQSAHEVLSVSDFEKKIEESENAVLIDVRTDPEVAKGILPGAIQIDYKSSSFRNELNSLDKSKTYFVYCAVGGRSGRTLNLMKELGFNTVYDLAGGMTAWKKSGKEVVIP